MLSASSIRRLKKVLSVGSFKTEHGIGNTFIAMAGGKRESTTPKPKRQKAEDGDYEPVEDSGNRVWSEKDEIALLKALCKQSNKSDMDLLLDTVKPQLDFEPSKRQVVDKIRRLKIKFTKTTDPPHLLGPHAFTLHSLSKKLWAVSPAEFMDKYPYMYGSIKAMLPRGTFPSVETKMIARLMATRSPKELDDMEHKWVTTYVKDAETANERAALGDDLYQATLED